MTPTCINGCDAPWADRILAVIVGATLLYVAGYGYLVVRERWGRRRK